MYEKVSQRFDWGPKFWRFALRSTFWPRFAWESTSQLPMPRFRLAQRIAWALFGYLKVEIFGLLCLLALQAARSGNWPLALLSAFAAVSSLIVIVTRLQAAYLISKESQL